MWELMAYFALGEFVRNKIDLNELFMKKSKNVHVFIAMLHKCCSLISMLLVVVMNIFNLNKKSIFNNCKEFYRCCKTKYYLCFDYNFCRYSYLLLCI